MKKRNIVVIGASAGGFEAITQLVAELPADLNASVFIVWHLSPDVQGLLPHILNKKSQLKAANAVNGEPIENGRIYVAPPDHHMLIEDGFVRVTRGPKENRFRPAVDPLFRSAAYSHGSGVIGLILSGALDDGSAGLWTVKECGGMAIVQDPANAEVPSMPENALAAVKADYIVPVGEMAGLLVRLCSESVAPGNKLNHPEKEKTEMEIDYALEGEGNKSELFNVGDLTRYTCPECHGVLVALKEGGRTRFRCHTGHAFSADSLLAAVTEYIEDSLWNAIRSVQESVMLLNHMGDHFAEFNQPPLAAMYFQKANEAEGRLKVMHTCVVSHEQLTTDAIAKQAEQSDNAAVG